MSDGFGSLPSLTGGDLGLSPALQDWLQQQAQAQQLAQAQGQGQGAIPQDVPQATPPGFSGFTPPTPPTGAPTGVVQPQAQGLAAAAMNALGPSSAEAATMPADPRARYISSLQAGGLTNPYGLGAVAAYGQRESRYSPSNITGSWSDPSESGEAGTSGGIMSWRGPRLAAMRSFTAGADDPVAAQASFMLAENPRLTQALQNAGSAEEAHRLMANAWQFAGFNRPGGESAARLALTQDYAARLGAGQALPGVATPRGGSMGATAQRGGFDLGGIVGQGSAVPGQSSPAPDLAALTGQPTALAPAPAGFSADAPAPQQPASPYGNLMSQLQGIANGQKAAQKQGQKQQAGGMSMGGGDGGGRPISLQQARAMFDPSRFFSTLRQAGVRGV